MVQSVLLFSLGFLSAAFLALMVAPAIWARAVALTKKRIEASVPLTVNEIQADKDQLRAEFAMATRRLEINVGQFKEKISHQMAEISKNREELLLLTTERDEKHSAIAALERQASELAAETAKKQAEFDKLQAAQNEARTLLEKRNLELERLALRLQDTAEVADSQKIELVARDTEIGSLSDKLAEFRREQKEVRHFAREMELENKAAQEALRQERKRLTDAEKKNERLLSQLSDKEEKLERREKEFSRVRDQLKVVTLESQQLDKKQAEADRVRLGLEAEVGELQARLASLLGSARGGDIEKAYRKLEDDREKLKAKVHTLVAEKKALEEKLSQSHLALASDWDGERRDTAVLREQINDLAAEVVRMTAALEGPDSPIHAALNAKPKRAHNDDAAVTDDRPVSLVDRVKALQKAAAPER